MMRLRTGMMVLALALAACGTDDGVEGEAALPGSAATDTTDTLSADQQREQRQRAVSESGLPGARGIGGALDASAAADARNAALDSID